MAYFISWNPYSRLANFFLYPLLTSDLPCPSEPGTRLATYCLPCELPRRSTSTGLILDKRLTWKQQTTKIESTCPPRLRKLNWLLKPTSRLSLGKQVLLSKSIVVTSMVYCIQFGMTLDSYVMNVQRAQKLGAAYDCRCAVVRQERRRKRPPHSLCQGADKPALESLILSQLQSNRHLYVGSVDQACKLCTWKNFPTKNFRF